jgi:hypothetical protein
LCARVRYDLREATGNESAAFTGVFSPAADAVGVVGRQLASGSLVVATFPAADGSVVPSSAGGFASSPPPALAKTASPWGAFAVARAAGAAGASQDALLAVCSDGAGTALLAFDLSAADAPAKRWRRVSLGPLLLDGEAVAAAATVLAESAGRLLSLPLVGGGTVAFSLAADGKEVTAVRVASGAVVGAATLGSRCFAVAATGASSGVSLALTEVDGKADGIPDGNAAAAPLDVATHGALTAIFPHVVERRSGGVGFRALAVTGGDSIALIQPGLTPWVREEALAAVSGVVFVAAHTAAGALLKVSGVSVAQNSPRPHLLRSDRQE